MLGWKPDVFWNATLYEFRCATEARAKKDDSGMSRERFEELCEQYPDG